MSDIYVPNIYFVGLFLLIYLISTGVLYLINIRKWKPPKGFFPTMFFLSIFAIVTISVFLPEIISIQTRTEWITMGLVLTGIVIVLNVVVLIITRRSIKGSS